MVVVIGAIVVIAAVIAGLAAMISTGGDPQSLTGDFVIAGYHVSDNASLLLLWGLAVGLIGLIVLGLLLIRVTRADRRELLAAHSGGTSTKTET
ncbi:hypothetical protein JMUB6875_03280 [Nocardia sp. JMUB6875]|uniref:hypothetical protein n=1 Tax=Nocardia sp. JMUB6875 TaxID=3158170 RepID=UPI0032E64A1D